MAASATPQHAINERWKGRVALVTGASSGIGYSVARALVERGMKVVGCARNIASLKELSKKLKGQEQPGSLTAITCDVSKEDQVAAMFQQIRQDPNLGRVDVCINNAGLCNTAPLLTGEPSQWREMFEVNVLGLMMCTQQSYKLMEEKEVKDGHIILVNSMAGVRVPKSPGGHCYAASKFAVTAIKEGLRNELRTNKSPIRISEVCPGIVQSQFHPRCLGQTRANALFSNMKCLQPEDITNAILYMLDAPPHVEVNDVMIRPTEQQN
ncbi:hypothetical protein BaRGS_00002226 [Batillaria attramentaria]|uniref:Dehydrogenase/reductase SDR family member 11 n=1 Tax=Batillaria attramentaria TaxID=370345 RepID=A0ABD0M5P7_9CAEN